jgi:hypothetical protein
MKKLSLGKTICVSLWAEHDDILDGRFEDVVVTDADPVRLADEVAVAEHPALAVERLVRGYALEVFPAAPDEEYELVIFDGLHRFTLSVPLRQAPRACP